MNMMNALGENEDQKYQTKLLESLLTKWLVNRDIEGQNESIFGITLLSQYDLVGIGLIILILNRNLSSTRKTGKICQNRQ